MIDTLHLLLSSISRFVSETFLSPDKRVFVGYLLSAALIAILWLLYTKRATWRSVHKQLLNPSIWLSDSAKTDYALLITNRVVMTLLSPMLLGQLVIATFWFELLHDWSAPAPYADWPVSVIVVLFTLVLFLLDDASRYLVHRWLHTSPILWRFHSVHHSATTLTPLTIFRTHPVEGILFSLRSAIVQGCCIGIAAFLFGNTVDLWTLFGVNIFIFAFNALGSNLRHSHIALAYPLWLERWLMAPAQHHIHHSVEPKHYNKNYGVFLAIWDRIGGSWQASERHARLRFGIGKTPEKTRHSWTSAYWRPFVEVFDILKRRYNATRTRMSQWRNKPTILAASRNKKC